jgi:hypothetical protein
MHCQRCGYLLFNLTRADCPECGEPYDIEHYRFEPGAVSFHCPKCNQPYYGNDARGLPFPREFRCAECGNSIRLQQMRVVPLVPDAIGWAGSAWDNRQRIGTWKAWWEANKTILFNPSRFFRNHCGQSIGEAWLFSTISLYVGFLPAMFYQFGIMMILFSTMAAGALPGTAGAGAGLPIPGWVMLAGMLFVGLVLPFFMQFVFGLIWTLAIQLALVLLAPQRKPIGHTFRAMLYSFGTYSLYIVPFCGQQAAGIWHIVALIIGLKEVHQISGGRATLAVLWPLVAAIALYFFIVALLIFFAVGQ